MHDFSQCQSNLDKDKLENILKSIQWDILQIKLNFAGFTLKTLGENMTNPIPPHRNAVEPFQDLTRRVERLEREAKGFRRFCGSLLFLCVAGFIISSIFKLVNG